MTCTDGPTEAWLAGVGAGTEMGEAVAGFDWTRSPLDRRRGGRRRCGAP